GPTREEIEQAEARRRVGSRMNFSSSSANTSSSSGKTGSPDGNAESGAVSGQPGHNLRGRRLLNRVTPSDRNATGTVEVAISVDRDGKVTSARAVGGTPTASSSASVRKGCVDASLKLCFSASTDAPASQSGTVVWRFD
ncbi:MAG: energy transducer TonB, partial [Muribaculaceae bacterium]|nr:energy transducer TonB [Muribaculaceae bacterium]